MYNMYMCFSQNHTGNFGGWYPHGWHKLTMNIHLLVRSFIFVICLYLITKTINSIICIIVSLLIFNESSSFKILRHCFQ